MPVLKSFSLPACFLGCCLAWQASGQENFGPVFVTAERAPAEDSGPYSSDTISAAMMEQRLVRSLPEAFREMPGVNVQKTSNGQGSPYLRGFTGFRTLALVDGIRLNNSTFREGPNQYWSTVDALALDRIELVRGQGSVQYGSDSVGGTVNLLTRSALAGREETTGRWFEGETWVRGASAEHSLAERAGFATGEGGKWGLRGGVTFQQFGDVRAPGFGRQSKTGYNQWAYDLRLDVVLSPEWTLTAAHQQMRQDDVWRTHSTQFGISWMGTAIGTDQRRTLDQARTLSYLRLAGRDLHGIVDSAQFTVSLQTSDELQDRVRANGVRNLGEVGVTTLGAELVFESETSLGRWVYGADYFRDWVDSGGLTFNAAGALTSVGVQGPVGDDSAYDLFGAFVQNETALGQRVRVYTGGRFTSAHADVGRYADPITGLPASYSASWENFSGNLRLEADLDSDSRWQWFGGVSQSFRSPNLSDLSRLDIALGGELEVASTQLKPERYWHVESGLRYRGGRTQASATYFHTWIRDMIVRQPTGRVIAGALEVTKANASRGYVHGVEISLTHQLDRHWRVFGDFAWTEGEADQYPTAAPVSMREPLSRVVPLMGRAGVRWAPEHGKHWIELSCLAHSRADRLNSENRRDTQRIPPGGTPGFAFVVLRGGWQVCDHVSLTAAVENLLNQDYRFHGSGSNEPGLGAMLGVKVTY